MNLFEHLIIQTLVPYWMFHFMLEVKSSEKENLDRITKGEYRTSCTNKHLKKFKLLKLTNFIFFLIYKEKMGALNGGFSPEQRHKLSVQSLEFAFRNAGCFGLNLYAIFSLTYFWLI